EDMFVPFALHSQRNRGGNMCMTKSFAIPGSKSELQQISDKWLLHSVLMLIQSWIEPMIYLQTTLERYDDAPDALLNKTKWVSDKLLSLEQGVAVLIRKVSEAVAETPGRSMLDEGVFTSAEFTASLERYDVQLDMPDSVLRDYTLLTCFKKDAHKMETFLKLLNHLELTPESYSPPRPQAGWLQPPSPILHSACPSLLLPSLSGVRGNTGTGTDAAPAADGSPRAPRRGPALFRRASARPHAGREAPGTTGAAACFRRSVEATEGLLARSFA
ncbi:hypothetical protein Z043_121822, partial [Scleropages formosus]